VRALRVLVGCAALGCTSSQPVVAPEVCGGLPTQVTTVARSGANALSVDGGVPAALGIFDPSLVYPAGAPGGAMAYSAVNGPGDISTAIALSTDEGKALGWQSESSFSSDGAHTTGRRHTRLE
jgi:hypothetical protein